MTPSASPVFHDILLHFQTQHFRKVKRACLALSQKDKLASLSESGEFESEEEYREKLEMLKESYFPANKAPKAHTETLSEGIDHSTESVSGPMANYLRTLSAVAKN